MANAGPVLEFLTTTRPFHEAIDDESRRIVRSHAIRDANRRKRQGSSEKESKHVTVFSVPAPLSNLTTKFRVETGTKRPSKTSLRSENVLTSEGQIDEDQGKTPKRKKQPQQKQDLLIVPGAGDFDPFETFPIKFGPKQHALIHYQNTSIKQNAFAFYSREQLFAHVAADPAWLNATLSLIALHKDLKIGKGISHECLYHRGEALRLVNERLAMSSRRVSNPTIGTIASLASFDITNGFLTSATMHISGMKRILEDRGVAEKGLLLLGDNALLQKLVAWVDLSYSTVWDLSPGYPLMSSEICRGSLSEFLSLFTPQLTFSLASSHDLFGEMRDIFQTLRLLSHFMSTSAISPHHQVMFSRGLYISEYKLLVVLDHSSEDDFLPLDRSSHLYGSTRLAAYLYLYMALREIPRTTMINYTLARRLKGILESNHADLQVVWKDDLHLLLWILFIGGVATVGAGERQYFVDNLMRTMSHVGLKTQESFKEALKEVLWLEDFCGPEARIMWNETR